MKRFVCLLWIACFCLVNQKLWAGQTQVVVTSPRLSEESSARNIQKYVLSFPGVRAVSINLTRHEVTVTYDSDQIEEQRVRQLIEQAP